MSSELCREPSREFWRVESNIGVLIGESLLEDIEGCGDELMLRRACAAGGGCPVDRVEVIRLSARATSTTIDYEAEALDAQMLQLGSECVADVPWCNSSCRTLNLHIYSMQVTV
jgi:hypothetical protein